MPKLLCPPGLLSSLTCDVKLTTQVSVVVKGSLRPILVAAKAPVLSHPMSSRADSPASSDGDSARLVAGPGRLSPIERPSVLAVLRTCASLGAHPN